MPSVLEQLQDAIVRELRDRLVATGATIVVRREDDVESQIESAMRGSFGLSVLVLDPRPAMLAPEARGPVFTQIELTVRVIENLLINQTGNSLVAVAERVSQALHLFPVPGAMGGGVMRLAGKNAWTSPSAPRRNAVTLDLHFIADGAQAAGELR